MPMYLIQGSYSAEAWARMMKNPEDREATLRKSLEAFGGKLHSFYFAFGDNDAYVTLEMPDNKSMMAAAIVATAGGTSTRTTVLISSAEARKAMQQAKDSQALYAAPGSQAKGKGKKK